MGHSLWSICLGHVCSLGLPVSHTYADLQLVNPLIAEGIYMYAFGQIQGLAEFENSMKHRTCLKNFSDWEMILQNI